MELMIVLHGGNWMYYTIHTRLNTAKAALIEFRNAAGHAGINIDNLKIKEIVLRDENGNDIDKEVFA